MADDFSNYDPVSGYQPTGSFSFNGLDFSDPIHGNIETGENGVDIGYRGSDLQSLSDLFSGAGYKGDISFGAGENSDSQISPDLINWMQSTGNHLGLARGVGGQDALSAGIFDKNNNLVGNNLKTWANDPGFDPFALATQVAAGFATGGLGAGLGLTGVAGGALSGAAGGALGSAMTGGDPLKGALLGGVGGGLQGFNPAIHLGIDNPVIGKIANSSIGGAANSFMTGRNPLQGALSGAINSSIPALGNYAGSQLSNALNSPQGGNMDFYDGTTGDSAFDSPVNTGGAYNSPLNSLLGYSQAPGMSSSSLPAQLQADNSQPTYGQSYATPYFMATGDTGAPQQQSNPIKEMMKSILMPSSAGGQPGSGIGSLVSSLAGIYSGYEQRRRAGQLAGNLSSMYGQNSPYAQALRQRLDRQDAAAGRRSQYGPREVELQGRLADANSRNAPMLQKLYGDQNAGLAQMGRSFVNLGNQTGMFKNLYDYIYGGQ